MISSRWCASRDPRPTACPSCTSCCRQLGVLQDRGRRVALVTTGACRAPRARCPAAIHVTPEAADGGPIAKLRDGDPIRLDTATGKLDVLVDRAELAARPAILPDLSANTVGVGRELFAPSASTPIVPMKAPPSSGSCDMARDPQAGLASVLARSPVIPVLVIDEVETAVRSRARSSPAASPSSKSRFGPGSPRIAFAPFAAKSRAYVVAGSGTVLDQDQLMLSHGWAAHLQCRPEQPPPSSPPPAITPSRSFPHRRA